MGAGEREPEGAEPRQPVPADAVQSAVLRPQVNVWACQNILQNFSVLSNLILYKKILNIDKKNN
jgi:hypothetical protein